ncbi:MAG: YidC/Oxa1 family membrane protein insertase [Planctomycetota bacterium]|nr:YidC/Oxa1 family membrane protein insertase [Planctomycetota bacterium]
MRGNRQSSWEPGTGRSRPLSDFGATALHALVINFLAFTPLLAIPSPDVVVNLFANAAQVLGLLTVVLGGAVVSTRRRPGRPAAGGALRWPFRVAAGLLVVSLAANALQYTGALDEENRRLRRNLVRSSKEDGKQVGDASLKTLSFSDQLEHPRGIDADELAALLAQDPGSLNLVDVREPEEVEHGRLAGSWHLRYPDLRLQRHLLEESGRTNVLLCYSGNRSSELCDEFANAKEPISCRFLIGGYEKWIADGQPMELAVEDRDELRSLPHYPRNDVLLDTTEVERLVEEKGAIFVDVRYEKDFENGHLPGARNIPLRKLPTPRMQEALRSLPRRPVIAVCYDKRSSFYGQILGLRLHRLGYEFLGRYTVPHEYYLAGSLRPHVEKWRLEADRGVFAALAAPLKSLLLALDGGLGHLALAIVVCVVILRLTILPLTLKAERDQFVLRGLAVEIARLKRKAADDRQRFSRSLLSLYRKHRIRPGRNLLGTLVQVLLFVVFFGAVSAVATGATDGFLWIPTLAEADPRHVLPILLGALIWAHLKLNSTKSGVRHEVLRLVGGGFLAAITFELASALNLYLLTNIALMMAQNRILFHVLLGRKEGVPAAKVARMLRATAVTPLRLAHRVPGTGNKASRLAQMKAAGLPVPDGFVITDSLLSRGDELRITDADRRRIADCWRDLKSETVAVRSSGLNEDGAEMSYAGVFESILNVRKENFYGALQDVHDSLRSQRAAAYSGNDQESGAALVQEMVPAEFAGVLFTEHPSETGSMLVELIPGLGDALVSGAATPRSFRIGRISGELLDGESPPIPLSGLIDLGRKVERLFGKPQDIEWAYAGGRFLLLQARDITTSADKGSRSRRTLFESERRRLLRQASAVAERDCHEEVFAQNELSELLPRPTPLSLSFMESLWAAGGSTDLACRALGLPYQVDEDAPPYLSSVFGALYINRAEERRRLRRGPGMAASFRLARAAETLERSFREDFLPGFLQEMRRRDAMDLRRLTTADLVDLFEDWRREFSTETYFQAELINVAADFYVKMAERQLTRHGLSAAQYLGQIPATVVHRAMSLLPEIQAGKRPVSDFLDVFGHRSPHDYELAAPRYREDEGLVRELVSRAVQQPGGTRPSPAGALPSSRVLRSVVDRARRFQTLKEKAKHHCLRQLDHLRRILLELDSRLNLDGGVFYLELAEIPRLKERGFRLRARKISALRSEELEYFKDVQLPARLTVAQLEALRSDGRTSAAAVVSNDGLSGTLVAGEKEVQGRARVIRHADEIDTFQDGEILVARFTDPTWTPLFPRAAGVVTEVGGRLSHAAIVAREYNVTTVVGVDDALDAIRTGDHVRLHLDGRVELLEPKETAEERPGATTIQLSLLIQDEIIEAIVVKINQREALVSVDEELETGQGIRVRMEDGGEVKAQVVCQHTTGNYALRFAEPIDRYGRAG